MKRDDLVLVDDILRSTAAVRSYTHGMNKPAFRRDRKTIDAVTRQIEILGEAVKNLSPGFREAHPRVPWSLIARMRDRLAHRYWTVDIDYLWEVVTIHARRLTNQLEKSRIVSAGRKTPKQLDTEIAEAVERFRRRRR